MTLSTRTRLHGEVCTRCNYRSNSAAEQARFTRFALHDEPASRQAVLCPRCTDKLLHQLRDFLGSYRDAATVAAMFGCDPSRAR